MLLLSLLSQRAWASALWLRVTRRPQGSWAARNVLAPICRRHGPHSHALLHRYHLICWCMRTPFSIAYFPVRRVSRNQPPPTTTRPPPRPLHLPHRQELALELLSAAAADVHAQDTEPEG
jgi:hypothetical protein